MASTQEHTTEILRPGHLRVRDIWALGVGIVVCGQYFGWNLGLRDNGPLARPQQDRRNVLGKTASCLLTRPRPPRPSSSWRYWRQPWWLLPSSPCITPENDEHDSETRCPGERTPHGEKT
jgi:hypothetical protein